MSEFGNDDDSHTQQIIRIQCRDGSPLIISHKIIDKIKDSYFSVACNFAEQIQENTDSNKIDLIVNCPNWIINLILDFIETSECKKKLKADEKEELIEWVDYFQLTEFKQYLHGNLHQLMDLDGIDILSKFSIEIEMRKAFATNDEENYKNADDLLINLFKKYPTKDLIPNLNKIQSKENTLFYDPFNIKWSLYLTWNQILYCKAFNYKNDFNTQFTEGTRGIFLNWEPHHWNNILIAGGAISNSLNPFNKSCNYLSDIDIFIYGLSLTEVHNKIVTIIKLLIDFAKTRNSLRKPISIYRTENAITISISPIIPDIQIILRVYKLKSEILLGFDIEPCCCGYDGTNVYLLEKTLNTFISRTFYIGIDSTRYSPSFIYRVIKYCKRGFAVIVPGLKSKYITNIEQIPLRERNGLAKLLYFHYKTCISHVRYPFITTTELNKINTIQNNYTSSQIQIPTDIHLVNWYQNKLNNVCNGTREYYNDYDYIYPLIMVSIKIGNYLNTNLIDNILDNFLQTIITNTDYEKLKINKENKEMLLNDTKEKIRKFEYDYRIIISKNKTNVIEEAPTLVDPKYTIIQTENPGSQSILQGNNSDNDFKFYDQALGSNSKLFMLDISEEMPY